LGRTRINERQFTVGKKRALKKKPTTREKGRRGEKVKKKNKEKARFHPNGKKKQDGESTTRNRQSRAQSKKSREVLRKDL